MTSKLKLLVAGLMASTALLGVTPAEAAGTAAGTSIQNNVSVNYQVGGVAQTTATASNTFVVDQKAVFTLTEATPTGTTTVVPGSTAQVTTFTLTNTSNATFDFALTGANITGGTAAHGGTDSFDITGLQVFVDSNGNGVYDPGVDTATYIDELAPDQSKTIFIVGNIPASVTNGQVAGVTLQGQIRQGGTPGSLGAVITPATDTTTWTPGTVQTIFADPTRTGIITAADDYTVSAAALTITKLSRIVSDGVSTTNPKAIPGAVVEYCIVVANAAGAATASAVNVADDLSVLPNLTFSTSFGVKTNGTTVSGNTCTPGTGAGSYNTGTKLVSGTLNNIAAGTQATLVFQATIN